MTVQNDRLRYTFLPKPEKFDTFNQTNKNIHSSKFYFTDRHNLAQVQNQDAEMPTR